MKQHSIRLFYVFMLITSPIFILATGLQLSVRAATRVVLNNLDSGPGSLRDTIAAASPGDTITFDPGVVSPIVLLSTIVLNKPLTIAGPGAAKLTIDGNNGGYELFQITVITTHMFSGLTLQDSAGIRTDGYFPLGGAIYLNDLIFNNAKVYSAFAAIVADKCIFKGMATIRTIGPAVAVTNSTFSDIPVLALQLFNTSSIPDLVRNVHFTNVQGSISSSYGLIIDKSTFIGGPATIDAANRTTITDSVFANNVSTNHGPGAIWSNGGILTIDRSLFMYNVSTGTWGSDGGGAIKLASSAVAIITNSTFYRNTSAKAGGALFGNPGSFIVANSTFFGNTAPSGSVFSIPSGLIDIRGSIIATDTYTGVNCEGKVIDSGNNLQYGGAFTSCPVTIPDLNPKLLDLADNGGPTLTMALDAGSPAIDGWPGIGCRDSYGTPITTDQRGFVRPVNNRCDIGAFESGSGASFTPTATVTPTPTVTPRAPDTVGVYDAGNWSLRNANSTGNADRTVLYGGSPSQLPIVGDWNGDGVDTIGVYDTSTGNFLLRNSNVGGNPEIVFTLGNPGDTPLAGRWDNTMTHDGAGVYRNSNGVLYLRKTLTTGFSDYFMILGNPGDIGLAGDWDNDGVDTVGVFRPGNTRFYLSNVNGAGITYSDIDFVFYPGAGGLPFPLDPTGSGQSRLGWLNTGTVRLRNTLTSGNPDSTFAYGPTSAKPIAGRWGPTIRGSYGQGFETVLPDGWSVSNRSNPLGTTSWFTGVPAVFYAANGDNSYAAANFNNTGELGTISDWLVSPYIASLTNGDTVTFYTRTALDPQYYAVFFPDRMQFRMSTNGSCLVNAGESNVGDFTTLLIDINPSLTTTGYPTTWTQYTATVSGLTGPTSGCFAFRYFVTNAGYGNNAINSSYIGVDSFIYTHNGVAPANMPAPPADAAPLNLLDRALYGARAGRRASKPGILVTPTRPPLPNATEPGSTGMD